MKKEDLRRGRIRGDKMRDEVLSDKHYQRMKRFWQNYMVKNYDVLDNVAIGKK